MKVLDWLTMTKLGQLCDALGTDPATLLDALHGTPHELSRRDSQSVTQGS